MEFASWPTTILDPSQDEFIFGVYDNDSFLQAFAKVVDGRKVKGRKVKVVKLTSETLNSEYHAIYIGMNHELDLEQILLAIEEKECVTIGDGLEHLAEGLMISIFIQENAPRFGVNLNSTRRVDFRMNSRVLAMAELVIGLEDQ
jgi:hypothetical protein